MYQLKESEIKICDSCKETLENMGLDFEMAEIEDAKCDICACKVNFVTYIKKSETTPAYFCWRCGKRLKNAFKIEDVYYCGECVCDVVNGRIAGENNKSMELEDKVDELQQALSQILNSISDFAEGLNDDWGDLKEGQ